jgi:patatin-like phospholipase/acyl hydrolase
VLAIDGGGIRGIVPTVLLMALQERLERPVVDYFDIVAGTSTGGLLASALCAPGEADRPPYTLEEILGFYTQDCRQIFHRSESWKLLSLDGMAKPKYPAEGMDAFLRQRFGELRLSGVAKPLVLVSYDIHRRQPWVFNSILAARDELRDFLLRDACRATTAAPTYFPAALIRSMAGTEHALVDGGVCANDPVLAGFVVADRHFPGRPLRVLSLGTGNLTQPISGAEAQHWGIAGWALHILEVLADGQSSMSETSLHRLLGARSSDGSTYRRLQPVLPSDLGRLDDTTPENVSGLERVTRAYCEENAETLEEIARLLSA